MRALVTGGAGLLGARLAVDAPPHTDLHVTWHRTPLPASTGEGHRVDLASRDATAMLIGRLRPDVVIHTAYAVADGERAIVEASGHVAEASAAVGAALVHLSSDVVFDGEHAPYAEDDATVPVSVYGRHKAAAEAVVHRQLPDATIVRTSLITWAAPLDPRSAWVADSLRDGDPITLFTDEIRCPVRLDDLSAQVWEIASMDPAGACGPWHLVGSEACSRHDLGVMIAVHAGLDPAGIQAASSRARPGPRPRDLRLTAARSDAGLSTPARSVRSLLLPAP